MIEVPQLITIPLLGAGVHGVEEHPEQVMPSCIGVIQRLHEGWQCVNGCLITDIAIVASSVTARRRTGVRQMGADAVVIVILWIAASQQMRQGGLRQGNNSNH